MLFRHLFALVLLIASVSAFAAEEEEEESSPWTARVYLGYLATTGNTETSSLNTGFEVGYTAGNWAHKLDAQAINSSENNVKTAESYDAGWKSERNFSEKDFLFGQIRGRKTRFGAYETQISAVLGYGRRLIDNEVHRLNGELGVGTRESTLQNGLDDRETILSAGIDYKWQFSETANFTQVFAIEHGDLNTYYQSDTAVTARLMGNLALVASYTIKKNSDVPPLTEKRDSYTALSLEYLF
jgi:putative salt-induced outer membrane protein